MPSKILILWSGGLDSTAVLKQYLSKTNSKIVALRVNYFLTNNLDRQALEKESIEKLLPKLKEIRDFDYVESTVQYNIPSFFRDVFMIGTHAIPIAIANQCDEVIIGFVEDVREGNRVWANTNCRKLTEIAATFFEFNKNKLFSIVPSFIIHPFFDSKRNYINELGEELTNLTWSCRNPKDGERCGECVACHHIKRSID